MRKNILFSAVALLCLNFSIQPLFAQQADTAAAIVKPVRPGDKLPDSFWKQTYTTYYRGKTSTGTLEAYKDRLLVLDFWATWCGSCLKKFNMSDSLQKQYGNSIAIVLVNAKNTRDTEEKIAPVMERYQPVLPGIISDTLLTKLFPHAVIPHYVWIEKGQFRAVTGSEFFSREGVAASVERRSILTKAAEKRKAQTP